jgi:hypothetical protein
MRKILFFSWAIFMGGSAFASARTILSVDVPEERTIDGTTLKLNGAGVRTATVLKVRIYVAAFYSTAPLRTEEDVLASPGPLYLHLTYVRAFDKDRVQRAWVWQFEQSVKANYDGFERDKAALINSFGELKKFGTEAIELVGDETKIFDDGVLKATIKGRDFQKAFLSMWFGKEPVMPELKRLLLGGAEK